MTRKEFDEVLGLEEEFIERYFNELNEDYFNINKLMENKSLNFVSFNDELYNIKLNNKTYYNGKEFSYVLGVV